jgi:hypothetical protein
MIFKKAAAEAAAAAAEEEERGSSSRGGHGQVQAISNTGTEKMYVKISQIE